MQATIPTRRFDPRQLKQAALAIAILTSVAIGVTTASVVRDAGDADRGRVGIASASADRDQTFGYQFLEQNLDLPTAGAASAINRDSGYVFMEQNLHLPGSSVVPSTDAAMDYHFYEMNLDLPGSEVNTAPNWQVLEVNQWGEDFNLNGASGGAMLPSADDVQQQRSGY